MAAAPSIDMRAPAAAPSLQSARARLSPTAQRLAAVFARYACFGHSDPIFRSKEFAKLIKEAGLETAAFNTRPPNRVDFVYGYACVHGPGGRPNNKVMSLEMFAYATKGMAHELGCSHEAVLAALEGVEPLLKSMSEAPPMPVSSRLLQDLKEKASGEDQYMLEKQLTSPLVRRGVLASYEKSLSKRDAEQAALSLACHHGPPRSPRVRATPEWAAYDSPDLRPRHIARRLVWQQPAPIQ